MATKKKAAKKKTTTKKAAVTKKVKAIKTAYTKSQLVAAIADSTELSKKDVSTVLAELGTIIEGHINKNGAKQFTLPGIMKVKVKRKPATKARKGVNPFTGEEMMFKAKPASNQVKILPLKGLKEAAI
jgi:nucleoid DNA-binding protein